MSVRSGRPLPMQRKLVESCSALGGANICTSHWRHHLDLEIGEANTTFFALQNFMLRSHILSGLRLTKQWTMLVSGTPIRKTTRSHRRWICRNGVRSASGARTPWYSLFRGFLAVGSAWVLVATSEFRLSANHEPLARATQRTGLRCPGGLFNTVTVCARVAKKAASGSKWRSAQINGVSRNTQRINVLKNFHAR